VTQNAASGPGQTPGLNPLPALAREGNNSAGNPASPQRSKAVLLVCPEGYTVLEGSCYRVTEERVAGSVAQAACRRAGGAAAVIDSQAEMDALRGSILISTVHIGTNIQQYTQKYMAFLLRLEGFSGFTNFHTSQAAGCTLADAKMDFAWRNGNCTELHPVLCKTKVKLTPYPEPTSCPEPTPHPEPTPCPQPRPCPICPAAPKPKCVSSCPNGGHKYQGYCYYVDRSHDYTWTEARSVCWARNMQLASITSRQENNFIWGLSHNRHLWIALNDRAREGRFVWDDGTSSSYRNWWGSNPDGGRGSNCVRLYQGDGGKMSDGSCSDDHGAACKGREVTRCT